MRVKNNKTAIFLIDILVGFIFFIPALLHKLVNKNLVSCPGKILIIELWGIGDLVMMSTVLKPLKQRFPSGIPVSVP